MVNDAGPAVGRRRLGIELRNLRTTTDRTMQEVAEYLGCSVGKISRLEAALVPPRLADVRSLASLYGLAAPERERLLDLTKQASEKAWWSSYLDVVPAESATFFGLEDGASTIAEYSAGLVPGLLQAPAYINAVMVDAPDAEPGLTERRVELRLRRQQLLRRPDSPAFHCVLDEAALHRRIGGRRAAVTQLAHLIEMSELPSVTVQVLPLDAGGHAQLGDRFSILRFANPADPQVVFVEGAGRNAYLDDTGYLEHYATAFGQLCDLAHSPAESVEVISRVAKTTSSRSGRPI